VNPNDKSEKRPPEELWAAIEREAENDEIARLLALSPAEMDAELRAAGFDPEKERALGVQQAREAPEIIRAEEEHREENRRARARLAAKRKARGVLDIEALKRLIDLRKRDPGLPAPAAVLYRNRGTDASTREELEAMLDELEDLIDSHAKAKG